MLNLLTAQVHKIKFGSNNSLWTFSVQGLRHIKLLASLVAIKKAVYVCV